MGCLTRSGLPVLSRDLCNLFPSILLTSIILHPFLLTETNYKEYIIARFILVVSCPACRSTCVGHAEASRRTGRVDPRLTKLRGNGRHMASSLFPWRVFFSRDSARDTVDLGHLSYLLALNDATDSVGVRLAPRAGRHRSSNLGSRLPPVRSFRLVVVLPHMLTTATRLALRHPARFMTPFRLSLSPDLGMSITCNWISPSTSPSSPFRFLPLFVLLVLTSPLPHTYTSTSVSPSAATRISVVIQTFREQASRRRWRQPLERKSTLFARCEPPSPSDLVRIPNGRPRGVGIRGSQIDHTPRWPNARLGRGSYERREDASDCVGEFE